MGINHNLTAKQKLWADIYFVKQDAKASAIEAGYPAKSAHVSASRLKNNPTVKAYLETKARSFALENKDDILALAKSLSKKDVAIAKALEVFEDIKDSKNATKFKWFELICKLNGLLSESNSSNYIFNLDNRTLNHTEIIDGAQKIMTKLHNLGLHKRQQKDVIDVSVEPV